MPDRDSVINDLNVARRILCNPQMLTPEMCIRIGQAITSAIAMLKEQEAEIRQLRLALDIAKGTCKGIRVEGR